MQVWDRVLSWLFVDSYGIHKCQSELLLGQVQALEIIESHWAIHLLYVQFGSADELRL